MSGRTLTYLLLRRRSYDRFLRIAVNKPFKRGCIITGKITDQGYIALCQLGKSKQSRTFEGARAWSIGQTFASFFEKHFISYEHPRLSKALCHDPATRREARSRDATRFECRWRRKTHAMTLVSATGTRRDAMVCLLNEDHARKGETVSLLLFAIRHLSPS